MKSPYPGHQDGYGVAVTQLQPTMMVESCCESEVRIANQLLCEKRKL